MVLALVVLAALAALVLMFSQASVSSSTEFPKTEEGVRLAIREGRKIEAIKVYRSLHAVGLKEAKEAVEAIESSMRAEGILH